jgi:threonine aldolase
MWFTSDNASGAAPAIMAAVQKINDGWRQSYGADDSMARVTAQLRQLFEAPEAAVFLVSTGTAANALALSLMAPAWTAVFGHSEAHIATDECGAPEFFTGGAKLIGVPGDHGKMTPDTLANALARIGAVGVHGVQHGCLSITNVTEAGTVYTPAEVAALSALAKTKGLPVHMDGARFANALVATGASPSEMTWKSGVDAVSFGGTKNGCMGVEAVILFDPARAWEFELRRKRAGHLVSKHRYLSAQMEAYLEAGLWLDLARHANAMGARLASGMAGMNWARLQHRVDANILFPAFAPGINAALQAKGLHFYPWNPTAKGGETARFVTSWASSAEDVDRALQAMRGLSA